MAIDLLLALEMWRGVLAPEIQPFLKAIVEELRRLREIEAAAMACFEAETDEEKRAGWAELSKLCQ